VVKKERKRNREEGGEREGVREERRRGGVEGGGRSVEWGEGWYGGGGG